MVAMISEARGYARGYIGVVQANQTNSLEVILPAKKWGRGRMMCRATCSPVPQAIVGGGNGALICVMTTIVDPLDDLDSGSLLAVCNL